jgi:predicted RNase H-like nuclease (RuvC/YqgF family)
MIKLLLKIIVAIVVVGAMVAGVMYFFRSVNAEKEALKHVIQQQEQQLKEKEAQIQSLQQQFEELQKESILHEKKISALREKRRAIKRPVGSSEVVERFKNLGYGDIRSK